MAPTDKTFIMIRMWTPVRPVVLAVFAAAALCADRSFAAKRAAGEQQNRSRKFGPGECGPVDPTYIHLANETGGQPFFLNPSEVGKAFHYVRESSGSHTETLLWTMGTFAGDSSQDFIVPVDSTVRRVTFAMSTETSGSDFILTDPTGVVVAAADTRTEITVLNCGRIVTVDGPASGTWRLRASGVGRFWITAHARTELSFVSAEFVRPGGRPGHEGLFRIHGQPIAGAPAILRATVAREHVQSASFDLVSQHGDEIGVRLKADTTYDDGEFVSTFDLPLQPFRLRVTGVDGAGQRFQRVFHTLFHAETVEVMPAMSPIDDVAPGSSSAMAFAVRNVGAASTFKIMAVDGRRMIARFEPSTLALDAGAAATVTVWINVPADATPGTGTDITVTAVSESQPPTTNGATLHVGIRN
jgi:hypothetical protein